MVDQPQVVGRASLVPDVSATISRPRMVNTNTYTIDLTDRFRSAANKLVSGTLVKDDHFTLFESVGALEIGDSKMDSGCLDMGDILEEEYDVRKILNPSEVLWLMDELLSREVAWHSGYPLSQTIFTSVYIENILWPDPKHLCDAGFGHHPDSRDSSNPLLDIFFRAYCLGLVKSCDLVMDMVKSEYYYEEEDFASQLYNRELLHRFPTEDILADMDKALKWLTSSGLDQDVQVYLHNRMLLRYRLLHILVDYYKAFDQSQIVSDELIERIYATNNSGSPVREAFSPKIQRRLASTIPPRPMVTIDIRKAFDFWKTLLKDIGNAVSVLAVPNGCDLLNSFWILHNQTPQPSIYARTLIQSFLSKNGKVCERSTTSSFVLEDMRFTTLAGSPLLATSIEQCRLSRDDFEQMQQRRQQFVDKVQSSFINIFRTFTLNRCRTRRTLCHAVAEWDQIQAEAEELDEEIQDLTRETPSVYSVGARATLSYSLSSWAYHYKLVQIRLIVQMGFELNVYAPWEVPAMYWYLAHVCTIHLGHLERISYFVSRREATLPPAAKQTQYQRDQAADCQKCLKLLYRHFSVLKATEALASALHGLYILLQRQGRFLPPPTTYSSDELRHEIRMKPFSYLSIPDRIPFDQFQDVVQMADEGEQSLLGRASSVTTNAKKAWEEVLRGKWNAEPIDLEMLSTPHGKEIAARTKAIEEIWVGDVRGCIRATIATNIAVSNIRNYLSRALNSKDGVRSIQVSIPDAGERDFWHPWWLVPRVSSVQKG